MTNEQKDKISKIYELVNRGATEGERAAAKKALDRIMSKYNLSAESLSDIRLKEYVFKYTTELEEWLLSRIMVMMVSAEVIDRSKQRRWVKQIMSNLTHEEWIIIECSYEYFRRHMKTQWKKVCGPELKKCRKPKTRNKRRKELYEVFFSQYVIKSKLYKPDEIKELNIEEMGMAELKDLTLLSGIQGGQYNKQVVSTLLLTN